MKTILITGSAGFIGANRRQAESDAIFAQGESNGSSLTLPSQSKVNKVKLAWA